MGQAYRAEPRGAGRGPDAAGEARVPAKDPKRGGAEQVIQLRRPDALGGNDMRGTHGLETP